MDFQVGTALLDSLVLASLAREDMYGYILTQNIKVALNISESTLYPILRRLQKENCLMTYDVPYSGRNRRYYQITDTGTDILNKYILEWNEFKEKIDDLLGGEGDEQN